MKESVDFKQYVAAVEMATLESKGSGELNTFDHVAKDLHQVGFDEAYEDLPQWKRTCFRSEQEYAIGVMALMQYAD